MDDIKLKLNNFYIFLKNRSSSLLLILTICISLLTTILLIGAIYLTATYKTTNELIIFIILYCLVLFLILIIGPSILVIKLKRQGLLLFSITVCSLIILLEIVLISIFNGYLGMISQIYETNDSIEIKETKNDLLIYVHDFMLSTYDTCCINYKDYCGPGKSCDTVLYCDEDNNINSLCYVYEDKLEVDNSLCQLLENANYGNYVNPPNVVGDSSFVNGKTSCGGKENYKYKFNFLNYNFIIIIFINYYYNRW